MQLTATGSSLIAKLALAASPPFKRTKDAITGNAQNANLIFVGCVSILGRSTAPQRWGKLFKLKMLYANFIVLKYREVIFAATAMKQCTKLMKNKVP